MTTTVIDLSNSPERPSKAAKSASTSSSASRKRARQEDTSTEACSACEGTGRVDKKPKKTKKEPVPSRWPWIDKRRPELQFKGTKIEFYNCGGIVFKATGKTMEDRLDKLEKWLAECDGDETAHLDYGKY